MTAMRPAVLPRQEGEPTADLTAYAVVHRGMIEDVRRLAELAAELSAGSQHVDGRRARALRCYLLNVSEEIGQHHRIEDDVMWPLIAAAAGHAAQLDGLTDDHAVLDPFLHRAGLLADRLVPAPHDRAVAGDLAAVLRELLHLLKGHIADEERDVFPLITRYVRKIDYDWAEEKFRAGKAPKLLFWLVGWFARHATAEETDRVFRHAPLTLRLMLPLARRRYAGHERAVFG